MKTPIQNFLWDTYSLLVWVTMKGGKTYMNQLGLWERIYYLIFAWFFSIYDKVENYIWPDRSCDVEATKQFFLSVNGDKKTFWKSYPERHNQWHVVCAVINPAYQGKGHGTILVTEAANYAQQERVIMGLSASLAGEFVYRKPGFEALGDFTMRNGDEKGGGIMIRYPEGEDK